MRKHDLHAHLFSKKVLSILQPFLSRGCVNLTEFIKENDSFPLPGEVTITQDSLTKEELYTIEVFKVLSSLLAAIDRIEEIQEYISIFPESLQNIRITRDKWISYHYSYYIVTKIKIRDISLRLTNAVCRLGIEERSCTLKNIKKKLNQESIISSILDDLCNVMGVYSENRNRFIHQGLLPDFSELGNSDTLRMYETIRLIELAGVIVENELASKKMIEMEFEVWIKFLLDKIEKDSLSEEKLISDLYDELLKEYLINIGLS